MAIKLFFLLLIVSWFGSDMIDVELSRENHRLIPCNCDWEGAEITW
jgi:hypothetical protein